MPLPQVIDPPEKPRLVAHARLQKDLATGGDLLLHPEGAVELSETAASIVTLCDGSRTVTQIVAELAEQYDAPAKTIQDDVAPLLRQLVERGLIVGGTP